MNYLPNLQNLSVCKFHQHSHLQTQGFPGREKHLRLAHCEPQSWCEKQPGKGPRRPESDQLLPGCLMRNMFFVFLTSFARLGGGHSPEFGGLARAHGPRDAGRASPQSLHSRFGALLRLRRMFHMKWDVCFCVCVFPFSWFASGGRA